MHLKYIINEKFNFSENIRSLYILIFVEYLEMRERISLIQILIQVV